MKNLFQKNKQPDVKIEDVLSNAELTRILDSLPYKVIVRHDKPLEITQTDQLRSKSLLLTRLVIGLFRDESTWKLGEYEYKIDDKRIERTAPHIKTPKKPRWIKL